MALGSARATTAKPPARICISLRTHRCRLLGRQVLEQRLGLSQIERLEPFGERAIDWREQIVGGGSLALIAPEPRRTHRRAQLPGLRLLLARHGERALEILLRLRRIRLS